MRIYKGIVSSKVPEKHLGYISCEEEGRDYFFHASGVKRDLYEELETGDVVTFVVTNSAKGEKAIGIEKTGG